MKLDPLKTTNAQRRERPFVLETPELAFDRRAALVELAPARRLARDQRVEAMGLDSAACGFAFPGRAAPLRRAALEVGPGDPPLAMLASRRQMVTTDNASRLAQGDDRPGVAFLRRRCKPA